MKLKSLTLLVVLVFHPVASNSFGLVFELYIEISLYKLDCCLTLTILGQARGEGRREQGHQGEAGAQRAAVQAVRAFLPKGRVDGEGDQQGAAAAGGGKVHHRRLCLVVSVQYLVVLLLVVSSPSL